MLYNCTLAHHLCVRVLVMQPKIRATITKLASDSTVVTMSHSSKVRQQRRSPRTPEFTQPTRCTLHRLFAPCLSG